MAEGEFEYKILSSMITSVTVNNFSVLLRTTFIKSPSSFDLNYESKSSIEIGYLRENWIVSGISVSKRERTYQNRIDTENIRRSS